MSDFKFHTLFLRHVVPLPEVTLKASLKIVNLRQESEGLAGLPVRDVMDEKKGNGVI